MALVDFGEVLFQLEQYGFYDFILPFLLVFAIVFGTLHYMKIFGDHKGVHVIIAFVLGLLAIRLPFFSAFLTELSPRLGVGLGIILALLILAGLFIPEDSRAVMGWILMGVSVVVFLIILGQLYNVFSGGFGFGSYSGSEIIAALVLVGLLIGIIVAVVVGGAETRKNGVKKTLKALWGD